MSLEHFVSAQASVYDQALYEIRAGRKRSHWMWFIFPQLEGLGRSDTARYYAIHSVQEAREYLDHPLLGTRLRECTASLLDLPGDSAAAVFGFPDHRKLHSSMTLFAGAAESGDELFNRVLGKFWNGRPDAATLVLLASR